LIVAVALIMRISLLGLSVSEIGSDGLLKTTPDGQGYLISAQALVSGSGDYESAFLGWAPGYPCLLALYVKLCGLQAIPLILVQILLSSTTCILCYCLALRLTGKTAISLLSGLILAFSNTSISLSCLILSDTVFLFLLFAGLVLFLDGFEQASSRRFVVAGTLFSVAVLTRAIGQFWMLILIAIGWSVLTSQFRSRWWQDVQARRLARKALLCVVMVVVSVSAWSYRNYRVHGIPAVSFASATGAANVATLALERAEGIPRDSVYHQWIQAYVENHHQTGVTRAEAFKVFLTESGRVLLRHPLAFLTVYFRTVWDNVNETNELFDVLIPTSYARVNPWLLNTKTGGLNYLGFLLTMLGAVTLAWRRQWLVLFVGGMIYLYFALMCGWFMGQGSRIFLPGLAVSTILMAAGLKEGAGFIMRGFRR
jgi:4-amino-4-deoxy-L-arabinose transferase-like glycosyltransferase